MQTEKQITLYQIEDAQERWVYEDLEDALIHIREGLLACAEVGEEYVLKTISMTRAEFEALPEQ